VGGITELVNRYDIDYVGVGEVGFNWSLAKNHYSFASWFIAERELRSTMSWNIHGPRVRKAQQGGTAVLVFNELAGLLKEPAWTLDVVPNILGQGPQD